MRVFFAIEFSKEIKDMLKSIRDELRDNSVSGNFTLEENFHLTVKFIGEIESKELEQLKECLDNTIKNMNQFKIIFTRLGKFDRGEKKLMWVGIENSDNGLINLFNKLEKELESAGYSKEERAFKPHITLGREVKLNEDFDYKNIKFESQDMIVNKVSIMESSRINGKLVYTPIYWVDIA